MATFIKNLPTTSHHLVFTLIYQLRLIMADLLMDAEEIKNVISLLLILKLS